MFIISSVNLKQKMRIKQKITSFLLAVTLILPVSMQHALAATGIIYITPGSSSIQAGSSETVSLRINPGTTVDGVQATVSYDPSSLQLNSVDNSASPFNAQLQKSAGGGTIKLSLGNLSGGVSSDALIANINFTALASSGGATLAISNANATSGGSYTNPTTANASIGFTPVPAPAPSPAPGPTSSSSASSPGAGGATGPRKASSAGAVSANPAAPSTDAAAATTPATVAEPIRVISKLGSVDYTKATIKVTSTASLALYALYGTDAEHLTNKTAVTSPTTKISLAIGDGEAALIPGTQYYYQVIGEDTSGVQTKATVQQFVTTGFSLQVTVLDAHNQPLKHVSVTLHSRPQTVTTDAHGLAIFKNVAPGEHHLQYQTGNHSSYSAVIYVENSFLNKTKSIATTVPIQTAAAILPVESPTSMSTSWRMLAMIALGGIAVAALLAYELFHHRFKGKHLALKLVDVNQREDRSPKHLPSVKRLKVA